MIDTLLRASGSLSTQTLIGPVAVDAAAKFVGVVMDKTLWTSLTIRCTVNMEYSLDSGQNWVAVKGFANEAGSPSGGQVFETRSIPAVGTSTRQFRATLTPTGPLITTVSMRTLDGTERGFI